MTGPPAKAPKFPLRLDQLAGKAPSSGVRHAVSAPRSCHGVAPQSKPSGLGLDSSDVRSQMVSRLRYAGMSDERVLHAMATVARHHFVDPGLVAQAYEDTSLPIGYGQTISKPSVVARMLELLFEGHSARKRGHLGRVLEIGTGCGYQLALLALLASEVFSIERLKPMYDKARELLAPVRTHNIRLIYADGMMGHPPNAPYDSIIAAAVGDELPPSWLAQLAPGGRLVAPMIDTTAITGPRQVLAVVDRNKLGLSRTLHESVLFVPLKSGTL